MQPFGYRPNFFPHEINPYEQRIFPVLPFLGGLAGGLLVGGLLSRPPYGYYPYYGPYVPPYYGYGYSGTPFF